MGRDLEVSRSFAKPVRPCSQRPLVGEAVCDLHYLIFSKPEAPFKPFRVEADLHLLQRELQAQSQNCPADLTCALHLPVWRQTRTGQHSLAQCWQV